MSTNNQANLWLGQLVDIETFMQKFNEQLDNQQFWSLPPLNHQVLFEAIERTREELLLKDKFYLALKNDLIGRGDTTDDEIQYSMDALIDFLNRDQLRIKLKRELGSEHPFELKRTEAREDHFEAWYPLGTLVHITPNNSALLSVLGVLEGLLSGNVNILKLARREGAFTALFFQQLIKHDSTNTLRNYIFVAKVSSKEKNDLINLLSLSDVISVWGGEESVQAVKEIAPKSARIVEWGHKISFSFISKSKKEDKQTFENMAREICLNEQMACSSPQCLFIEDAQFEDLKSIAKLLGEALNKISPTVKRIQPSVQELAELTVTKEQVRLKSIFKTAELVESSSNDWRIYIDEAPALQSSPLYRTIWLKPMPREKMINHLRPLKHYLQTAGVAAEKHEIESLTRDLFLSGVQRVRAIGEMTDSYIGEPHDGVYALERFCQRINFKDANKHPLMEGKASFEDLQTLKIKRSEPIMEKADFQNQKVDGKYADLFFYSGGSSGEPKLSMFTYEDYHRQMEVAAEGLYAAGLDPKNDRCMNLFYAGSLYGGFTSFFTILEKLKAIHFPMGASTDFAMVGNTIVRNNVDTLLGMPSYLGQLFSENEELFKKYKGIKKVFYGGEHFSEGQKKYLKNTFGVELIRSATYGSVDAGPLGFQCPFAEGGIHHLHEKLHDLEIVKLDSDSPVTNNEVGRLLFTSKVRHGQKIVRYAIGDVGRYVTGACECGRVGTRFELMGRFGDVFRIGTVFLSYQKVQKILLDQLDYSGSFQLHLYPSSGSDKEKLQLKIEKSHNVTDSHSIYGLLVKHYTDLAMAVNEDKVLSFETQVVERQELTFNSTTGKLKSVIDHRVK